MDLTAQSLVLSAQLRRWKRAGVSYECPRCHSFGLSSLLLRCCAAAVLGSSRSPTLVTGSLHQDESCCCSQCLRSQGKLPTNTDANVSFTRYSATSITFICIAPLLACEMYVLPSNVQLCNLIKRLPSLECQGHTHRGGYWLNIEWLSLHSRRVSIIPY